MREGTSATAVARVRQEEKREVFHGIGNWKSEINRRVGVIPAGAELGDASHFFPHCRSVIGEYQVETCHPLGQRCNSVIAVLKNRTSRSMRVIDTFNYSTFIAHFHAINCLSIYYLTKTVTSGSCLMENSTSNI